jgi:hypothetical protein
MSIKQGKEKLRWHVFARPFVVRMKPALYFTARFSASREIGVA